MAKKEADNTAKERATGILKDIIFATKIGEAEEGFRSLSPAGKSGQSQSPFFYSQEELHRVIMTNFGVRPEDVENLILQVNSSYTPGEVELCLESFKAEEFSLPADKLECRIILGPEEFEFTPKISSAAHQEWISDFTMPIIDICNSSVEIHFFSVMPREESDHFGRGWLKTLDSFGQRLKSSFRASAIIPSSTGDELNNSIGSTTPRNLIAAQYSTSKRASTNDLSGLSGDKQQQENWMQSAFSSFRQSKKKRTFNRSSSFEINNESLANEMNCPRKTSEGIEKDPGKFFQCSTKDIQAKDEISVQRQLDSSEACPRHHSRTNSDSLFGSFKNRSFRVSPKKDLQFWKRINNSFQEKIAEALETHDIANDYEEGQSLLSFQASSRRSSLVKEHLSDFFTRERLGSVRISLMESFLKCNCSNWVAEIPTSLVTASCRKESKPCRQVTVVLRWSAKAETPRFATAFECFEFALEKLFDPELAKYSPLEEDDLSLPLPVSVLGKAILKKIAFAFDVTDAEVSLASWLVISKRITQPTSISKACTESLNSKERLPSPLESCIHPEYFHMWLLKLDSLGSHYTLEEHERLGGSIYKFVSDELVRRFKRLHAAFSLTHSSYLVLFLRCSLLISESASILHSVRQHTDVNPHWAVTCLLDASKDHAKDWSNSLIEEMSMQQNSRAPLCTGEGVLLPSFCKSLVANINKVEIVLTAVNDFLMLGQKVYEPAFQSELNVSYMSSVWRTIGETSIYFLEPLRKILLSLYPQGLQKNQMRDLLEIHPSLWILLLQLSKLYRFQERNEAQEYLNWYLPDTFCDIFLLVTYLWTDFALVRAMDTLSLEIESDSFEVKPQESNCISSSAQEIVNVIKVMQERLSLLCFPGGFISKRKVAEFLLPKILEIVRTYKCIASETVLKKCAGQNTVTLEICVLASNMEVICQEAGNFLASLYMSREKCADKLNLLKTEVKDLCANLLSKRLPGLPHLIASGLSKNDGEESKLFITSGIITILEPVEASDSLLSQTILAHFWRHLFHRFENQQRKLVQISEFRRLGIVLSALYFTFKSYYGIQIASDIEQDYQKFMENNSMKSLHYEEVIHKYYSERYEEQCNIHSSASEQLVINAYYNKGGKGLVVSIYMAPYVKVQKMDYHKASSCRSSCSNIYEDPYRKPKGLLARQAKEILQSTKEEAESISFKFMKKATGLLTSMSLNQGSGIYVKAALEPQEWFKDIKAKKTKKSNLNPPVFDEDLYFNITPEWNGVKNGGYLVLKLKVATPSFSCVHSEAVLPLLTIPMVSAQGKRANPHTYMGLSRPEAIQDYKSLMELESRFEDKGASNFLSKLKDSFGLS